MDKPTVNQQLADSSVLQGISVNRVAKKIRGDVLSLLAQLRDSLTAKLNSDAVMTDWQRQRAGELLKFASSTIDGAYQKIGTKTVAELDGLSDVGFTPNARGQYCISGQVLPARTQLLFVPFSNMHFSLTGIATDVQFACYFRDL